MTLTALWLLAKNMPWKYIGPAIGFVVTLWAAYSWAYGRGYSAANEDLAPRIAQLEQIELERKLADKEAERLAKRWEQRRAEIEAETKTVIASVRADNDSLRERMRVYVAGSGETGNTGAEPVCTLDAARRIVYAAIGEDLVRLAAEADAASIAADACNREYAAVR